MHFFVRVSLPSDFWRAGHCFLFLFFFPVLCLAPRQCYLQSLRVESGGGFISGSHLPRSHRSQFIWRKWPISLPTWVNSGPSLLASHSSKLPNLKPQHSCLGKEPRATAASALLLRVQVPFHRKLWSAGSFLFCQLFHFDKGMFWIWKCGLLWGGRSVQKTLAELSIRRNLYIIIDFLCDGTSSIGTVAVYGMG